MTTESARPRPKGTRVTARMRIMLWLLGLMTLVLGMVVLVVTYQLESGVDDRANRSIEQEAQEFATFARHAEDPRTGEIITDPGRLLRIHLSNQYPDANEVHSGVLVADGGFRTIRRSERRDTKVDDAVLRRVIAVRRTHGETRTSAGPFWWAKVAAQTPDGRDGGWFVTGIFLDRSHERDHDTIRMLVLVSGIGLLLAAAVSWLVAGQILAPIRTVRQTAARITEEDLTRRIPVHGRDDIAALSEQFNAMLDRLEQAFTTQREFIDDASHELRTPITIVRGHLEVMGDDPAERAEVVRICTDELDRMSRIVEDLLLLAKTQRPDFLRRTWVSTKELTLDIDAKVRALGERDWVLESAADGPAWLDPQRITQAVVQLAQNAVQHTDDGARILLGSSLRDGAVSLWVSDTGPGIAPADAQRIFERFARAPGGRTDASGAGLGLAIVKAIAEAHHGDVRLMSEPGRGTTVGVELPTRPSDLEGQRRVAAS